MKYTYKGIVRSLQNNVAYFYFEPHGPGKPIVTSKTCIHIHKFEPVITSFTQCLHRNSFEVVEGYVTQAPYDYALHIRSIPSENDKAKVKYYKPENKGCHGLVLDYNQDTRMFTVAFGQSVSILSFEQISSIVEQMKPRYHISLIRVEPASDELKVSHIKAHYTQEYNLRPSSSDANVPGQSHLSLQDLLCVPAKVHILNMEKEYHVMQELAGLTLNNLESFQPCLSSTESIGPNLHRDLNESMRLRVKIHSSPNATTELGTDVDMLQNNMDVEEFDQM